MIKVVYFASVRERLALDEESLEYSPALGTVAGVIAALVELHGEPWDKVLQQQRILCAVNQVVAEFSSPVADGDEVAFFPPVTGG